MASKRGEEVLVTSLGDLYRGPHEHKYWSSKRGRNRYPYPVGYQAIRLQGGHEYQLEVAAGQYGPEFMVTDPRGICFSAETAIRVWSIALRANGRAGHVKENTDVGEIFGFNQPMVKKYLQDLVAKSEPHASVPTISAPPLSPLVCNTPTASRRNRKPTPKPASKPLPAKASPMQKASEPLAARAALSQGPAEPLPTKASLSEKPPAKGSPAQRPSGPLPARASPSHTSSKPLPVEASPSLNPTPRSAPAKRPASGKSSQRRAKKSKGETSAETPVLKLAKESSRDAAERDRLIQADKIGSVVGADEGNSKRQKLGELQFASNVGAEVDEAQLGAEHHVEAVVEKAHVPVPEPAFFGGDLGTTAVQGCGRIQKRVGDPRFASRGGSEVGDALEETSEEAEAQAETGSKKVKTSPVSDLAAAGKSVGTTSMDEEDEGVAELQKQKEPRFASREGAGDAAVEHSQTSRGGIRGKASATATAEKVDVGVKPVPTRNEDVGGAKGGGGLPEASDGQGLSAEGFQEADERRARLAAEKEVKLQQREALRQSLEANRTRLARSRAIQSWRREQRKNGMKQALSADAETEDPAELDGKDQPFPRTQIPEGPVGSLETDPIAVGEEADVRPLEGMGSAMKGDEGFGKQGPLRATDARAADGPSGEQTGASAREETQSGPAEDQAQAQPSPNGNTAGEPERNEELSKGKPHGGVGLGQTTDCPSRPADGILGSKREEAAGAVACPEADGTSGGRNGPEMRANRGAGDVKKAGSASEGTGHDGRPEHPEGCPNHGGGCDRLSWSVDMEAETESESELPQSVGARVEGSGRLGDVEVESAPAGVGATVADVSMGGDGCTDVSQGKLVNAEVSGDGHTGATVSDKQKLDGKLGSGADLGTQTSRENDISRGEGLVPVRAKRARQRHPVEGMGPLPNEDGLGCTATQPIRTAAAGIRKFLEDVCSPGGENEGQSGFADAIGRQGDFADEIGRQGEVGDEIGRQGGFADDSTEPADFPVPSPVQSEGELTPLPVEVTRPESGLSALDFEGETVGWFTAVRGRQGGMAGLVGAPGPKDGACGQARTLTTQRGFRSKGLGCKDDVTKGTEESVSDQGADVSSGAAELGSSEAKLRNKRRNRGRSAPTEGVPVAGGRKRNRSELGLDGSQKAARREGQASPEKGGIQGEPPSAEPCQEAPGGLEGVLAGGGTKEENAAPPSQREFSVPSRGGRKRARRLSLTPFKAAMEWMATEEGKATAEKLKADVGVAVAVAGQPSGKGGERNGSKENGGGQSPGSLSGAKPKMGRLKRLSTLGWRTEAGVDVEPVGVAKKDEGNPVELAAVVVGGTREHRTVARVEPSDCSDETGPGEGDRGPVEDDRRADGEAGTAMVPERGEGEGNVGHAEGGLESRGESGGVERKGEKRMVRIVGSDSLTEQQSETEADEGAAAFAEAALGLGRVNGELTSGKEKGELEVVGFEQLEIPMLEEPLKKRGGGLEGGASEADARRKGDMAGEPDHSEAVPKAEAMEAADGATVRKGGLMPLKARTSGQLLDDFGGRPKGPIPFIDGQTKGAVSGGFEGRSDGAKKTPESPRSVVKGSPGRSELAASSPASSGDRKRSSFWFGRAVDRVSQAFKPQPGYKPLALTRSRETVSGAASAAHAANVDTAGKGPLEKSRPRNKSLSTWTGPTTNLNLVTPGGSAQKPPRDGRASADISKVTSASPKAADVSRMTSASRVGADVSKMSSLSGVDVRWGRSKALESQAQRFGRFEESEAVRDWSVGDFVVPSTPPKSPIRENPLDEPNGPDHIDHEEPELQQEEGLVQGDQQLLGGVQNDAQTVGQGLQRDALSPVCCLVHQMGPVLWTVVHMAGQEARLGVCIENDKAERSVFVYGLCMAAEPSDWKVDVLGELLGTVRSSEDPEQVASSVPFLEFSPDGQVLVVSDTLVLNGLSPAEAASRRPCIRLVSQEQQRPQVLARLECASASSCLLATGPRILAAGEKQGVVECWAMKPDWRSHDEKWSLPVARYRGVTLPAIQQLLKVPGRANQLLGCSENGSFALWDIQKRTLLSTCHPMHHVITSAHVLGIQLLVARELRWKTVGPDADTGTLDRTGEAGNTGTANQEPANDTRTGCLTGADKQAGACVIGEEELGTETAGHFEERILTRGLTRGSPRDEGEDLDGVKPVCLLVRATEREDPGKGAACRAALLEGDTIAVGKELLVAKSSVHVAALGAIGVATDDCGRVVLWDAPTGRAVALLRDLEGATVSSVSAQQDAGILAVAARDGRVAVYIRRA